ncbi:MAG: hypothetical protein M0R74_11270 [Dehalococcoidia bacterium]|jgi:hypothetical protein|nr:hypothetical protein [Dehalococcoidia bacterium]
MYNSSATQKVWRPLNNDQAEALRRSEFEIFTGGERGGGKSEIGRAWLLEPEYINHPMYRCLVIRKNSVDLDDWIFKMKSFCGDAVEIGGNPTTIKFPGGGRGTLGHLANKDSWSHYVGHEYQKILFEEINLIPEEQRYLMVLGSCRSSVPELKPQCMSSGNPGNVGHIWVKKRFVDCARNKTYIDPKSGLSRIFIPLKLRKNTKLPHEYEQTLRLLPVAIQKAWLEGDWDALAGQMFPLMPEQEDPRELTEEELMTFDLSFDFGSSDTGHSSVGGWYTDCLGRPHRMFTWYHRLGHTAGEQALELHDYVMSFPFTKGRRPRMVYSDPAIFAKRREIGINATPKSVADIFADTTLWEFVPAPNDRRNGWRVVNNYFGRDPLTTMANSFAWTGYNNTFYDHFSMQVRDDDDPDDIADNNYDHVCDETRYYLVSHLSIGAVKSQKRRRIEPQTAGVLF